MARRRWKACAALGAAFLAFELAAPLAVALVAQCLLFGWNDAATAWWCLRRDPVRSRGWLAAGLHAASALLKVGAGAFGCLMLVGVVAAAAEAQDRPAIGPAEREPPAFLVALVFEGLGSIMAAWGLANLTCVVALWRRRKLWVGPEAGLARVLGVWPPWAADFSAISRPANRLGLVLCLVVIPWALAVVSGGLIGMQLLIKADALVAAVIAFTAIFSLLCTVPSTFRWVERRLVASSPFEAWELEAL